MSEGQSPQDRLDELLEKYLILLDAYEQAQKTLSQSLSSGFLSLAQANFSNSGPRIGKDFYDDRMRACRRVMILDDGKVSMVNEAKPEPSTAKIKDPIQWFGMMTPAALKSSQASFLKAAQGSVPDLVNLSSEIKAVEISIGRLRKSIRKSANNG